MKAKNSLTGMMMLALLFQGCSDDDDRCNGTRPFDSCNGYCTGKRRKP